MSDDLKTPAPKSRVFFYNKMTKRISIQGQEGSFHQQAAMHYFGSGAKMVPCSSFRELIQKAGDTNEADYGLMAIENSIAGPIMPNYGLLQKSGLSIVGEVYLTIRHHLMVYPGVKLDDIKEVHSHPMALLQCAPFLEQFPNWKLVETQDTAFSARYVRDNTAKHVAAIAGDLAANLFNLDILAREIQSMSKNYTRFLALKKEPPAEIPEKANKASVYFQAEHHRGSLAAVLIRLAASGINLSKLQSVPIPGTDWEYGFYADMEFSHSDQFTEVKNELKHITKELRVFGVYSKGTTI